MCFACNPGFLSRAAKAVRTSFTRMQQAMRCQRSYQALNRSRCVSRGDIVVFADLADDFSRSLATIQSLPNHHRCFIERVVAFGIEIDQHRFAAIELRVDNMTVGSGCGSSGQALGSHFVGMLLVTGGRRRHDHGQRASVRRLRFILRVAPGNLAEALQTEQTW